MIFQKILSFFVIDIPQQNKLHFVGFVGICQIIKKGTEKSVPFCVRLSDLFHLAVQAVLHTVLNLSPLGVVEVIQRANQIARDAADALKGFLTVTHCVRT